MSDDISKEGLTKDLEVMRGIGIGEAYIGNVDTNPENRGTTASLSPEWWDSLRHAMEEGARLGVNIGMFNSPGWSQSGGPWVKPEQAMRNLAVQEFRITGKDDLPARLVASRPDFQPVRLLAYREVEGAGQLADDGKVIEAGRRLPALTDGHFETTEIVTRDFEVQLPKARTVRTAQVYPGPEPFYADFDLQVPDAGGGWRSVERFTVDRRVTRVALGAMNDGPITIRIPPTTSDRFRFSLRKGEGDQPVRLAEIVLREAPLVERYVEKQLGKMWQTPEPNYDAYLWPRESGAEDARFAVPASDVIDLTANLRPDGSLDWDAGPGTWRLAWFGMVPTGATNNPATPAATGLEVDKMNAAHLRAHFESYVGRARDVLSPQARANFTLVIADSYEQGAQNWTDDMVERFVARYGYDPVPFLPTLTGTIVGSTDASDRFLWDLRRLVADLVSTEYVGALSKLSREEGMQLWLENYGHWGFPGEFLQYGGQSDQVGAEFWVNPEHRGDIEIPAAVSASRVYAKPRVSAEAFTNEDGKDHWSLAPWSLKRLGDKATSLGINHFVLHVNIHQPRDQLPGVNSWFGTEFNRNNTWYPEAKPWIDYLRRVHGVLQAGVPRAEVLYFIGEDAPKMAGLAMPEPPDGIAFDYVNAQALRERISVRDGRWVLPNGTSYAVLVMPVLDTMTPETLSALADHVAAGGQLYGRAPVRSPSLAGGAGADTAVRELAERMWSQCGNGDRVSVSFGNGRIHCAGTLANILASQGVDPQVSGIDHTALRWAQVATPSEDVFFLANQTDRPVVAEPVLATGRPLLQIWDPVSGDRQAVPAVASGRRLAASAIHLAPFQSVLLVAGDAPAVPLAEYDPQGPQDLVADLSRDWDVSFDRGMGGPASARFGDLVDWSTHADPAVRFYSGRATYRKEIDLAKVPEARRVWLDLGSVRDMAIVSVNGRKIGTLWTAPWRIEVTDALADGRNLIQVEVINTWGNRIIGDLRAGGASPRLTTTVVDHVTRDSPLNPAGLLGPVRLLEE